MEVAESAEVGEVEAGTRRRDQQYTVALEGPGKDTREILQTLGN
ncbi:MAG: hypothetical protein ACE10D_07980 [Planctomycetota bacterium]